jgi:hypothetical protein
MRVDDLSTPHNIWRNDVAPSGVTRNAFSLAIPAHEPWHAGARPLGDEPLGPRWRKRDWLSEYLSIPHWRNDVVLPRPEKEPLP